MKPALLLLIVLNIYAGDAAVMAWDGPAPEMNGVSIHQVVNGAPISIFVENNKVYSNVLAKEKCDFGIFVINTGGGLDEKEKTIHTTLRGIDDNKQKVYFGLGLSLDLNTKEYKLLYLKRIEPPKVK